MILKTFLLFFLIINPSLSLLFGQSKPVSPLSLNPTKPLSQYTIDSWASDEGLASKTLTKIVQSEDGYLWVGSFNGLFRFDGIQFKPYTKQEYPNLKTNSFTDLYENNKGDFFVGTGGSGVLKYQNNKFKLLGDSSNRLNKPIESIHFGVDGKLWIGTRGAGVFTYENGKYSPYLETPLLEKITVSAIATSTDGTLWFGTEGNGLISLKDGNFKSHNTHHGLLSNQILDIYEDSKGTIWIATTEGVNYQTSSGNFLVLEGTQNFPINTIIEDIYQSLWIASTKGLFRLNGLTQRLEFLSEKDGLPHQSITDLAIDREGSLWLGTYRAGLCRLRDASFENFTMRNGLSALVINTVCELDNFRIMVGTGSGDLHIINDNNVIDFPIKTELTNSRIKHVNQTSWGDILVSTYSGLLTIKPSGEEILLDDKSGLPDNQTRVTLEDNDGNIWIGTRSGGAVKYNPITKEIEILNQDNGLSSDFIMAIEQDKAKKIYFGLNSAGLDILFPNGEVENYGIDELGTNLVFNIHLDKEGNAWIATNAGMTLLKPDGETYRFTTENGLTSEVVFDILEDDLENLWFTSSEGVFTAPKQSFLLIAEGKESYLSVRNYGKEDGMVEKETTGATQSLVGSGGKLFFPTLGGLSVFDPNYKIEALPQAPVYINQVLADGQTIDLESKEIKLSSDLKRVSFNYTVLNLTTPHKIKFQYKLKDYEDWVNAHGERQAVYTNISSGWHEFQVRASDSNGNFDKGQSDTIRFYRSPKFYETYFFYISVFLITAGFAFLFYRIRIKTIQKRNKELEALIDKRTYQIQKQKDKLELAYNDIRTVSSIGQEVTSVLDVDVLINTVYENVKTLMQTDIFGIAIYSKSDKQLEFRNLIRNGEILPSYIEQLKDGLYLSVKCFNSNEPIFINNTKEEYPEFDIYLNTLNRNEEEDSKSAIFVPLVIDKKPVGVLTVQSLNLDSYKNQHLTILEALASYISVALENSRIYAEITNKNHQITNSIRYAETIQQAVLPSIEKMNEALHEYFIIYKPKDIVSGDFYWFTHLGDKIFIAAVDCTGHGVPGAFMSMIGSSLLNEIVNLERITNPSEILKRLDIDIQIALKQEKTGNSDGMDVALCVLEPAEDFCAKITFSGAKRPLYYVQDGILEEVKGVNKAIGGKHKRPDRMFKSEEIILKPGSIFYLSTDGLVDQNSSTDSVGKRYGTTRLKELIEKSNSSDMESQKAIFEKSIEGYQGDKPQRDDITIIGVRV